MTLFTAKPTHTFTLDNGLQVIVREDHRTAAFCASLFHKIGTRNERPGQRGLAYLTGSAAFKDKALVKASGGVANGWLDYDVSTYSLEAPRAALAPMLNLLAMRMLAPALSQERLNAGIKHTQTLELGEPYFTSDYWITPAFEQLIFPNAGKAYKFGDIADLERITIDDVLGWHKNGYAPDNSILVIVGDVSLEEIQPVVQRLFGDIPRVDGLARLDQAASDVQTDPRTLTEHLDTARQRLQMAFNVPSLATVADVRDMRALQVISALLTSGPEAWLPGRLSEGQATLSSVITRLPAYRRSDDLFLIAATAGEHTALSLQHIELEIKQLLETLKTQTLETLTLAYAQQQAIEKLSELETLETQTSIIGNLHVIGQSWTLSDSEAQQLQSITAQDIQRVASQYFTPERLSVAYVLPRTA